MKTYKKIFPLILVLSLSLVFAAGCSTEKDAQEESPFEEVEFPYGDDHGFSYSDGIDENGHWIGIAALDYVELFEHRAMPIPSDVFAVQDSAVQAEIDAITAEYLPINEINDRAVVFGDTVNIDFHGTIGGEEFENGSTDGFGVDVTVGVTNYIEGFLEQLIGHMPGDIFDIEVTFPDDYYEVNLRGENALFVTRVNYIIEAAQELTDEIVSSYLFMYFGWTTVDDIYSSIREVMQKESIEQYLQIYFTSEVVVRSIPDQLIEHQTNNMLASYREYAMDYIGMDLEAYLQSAMGISGIDEFVELNYNEVLTRATFYLVAQAVAEDAGIFVDDDYVSNYIFKYFGTTDYSSYEQQYGRPYLKQVALCQKVLDYIAENAVAS